MTTTETPELWAVHVEGPDDLFAVASRKDAEAQAEEINVWREAFAKRLGDVQPDPNWHAVVVPWAGTAEDHARALAAEAEMRSQIHIDNARGAEVSR